MAKTSSLPHSPTGYFFQAQSIIKMEEVADHVFPTFKAEYDDLDLDTAFLDADLHWDASNFDACFFADDFDTDCSVPCTSGDSCDTATLAASASCTSLDSNCSSAVPSPELFATATAAVPRKPRSSRPLQPAAALPQSPLTPPPAPLSSGAAKPVHAQAALPPQTMTRQQRVQRYREKRKRRTFEKTIRYEARRAYAEVRPRIKGRFATKDEALALRAAKLAGIPFEC